MTNNRYISILLSVLVVLCPFQCIFAGCLTSGNLPSGNVAKSGGAVSTVISTCCGRCGQRGDGNDEQTPSAPESCPCGDCFCRGALPINGISDDVILAELVSFMTSWVELATTPIVSPSAHVEHASIVPFNGSALEVRAALSCWII